MRVPQATVTRVKSRAGYRCERCGTADSLRWSIHHRRPRGMGGTRNPIVNSPANLILLCGSGTEGCHGWIESHRTASFDDGLLLHMHDTPSEVPVVLRYGEVFLDDEGGVQSC